MQMSAIPPQDNTYETIEVSRSYRTKTRLREPCSYGEKLLGNATEVDNECRLCPNFKESQATSFTTPTTDTDGRCTQEWPPMPGTGSAIKEGLKERKLTLFS